jgi:hypothetical protein
MKAAVQANARKSASPSAKRSGKTAGKTAGQGSDKPAGQQAAQGAGKGNGKSAGQAATKTAAAAPPANGRRLQVRKSGVHGKGVYAVQPFKKGEIVIEYVGEVISWTEALRRHPHDPSQPDHTFYFHLDDERTIDGKVGGNASRWINHACAPNIEAEDDTGRVFLRALRNIKPGEELFFDYGLVTEERYTAALKKRFACHCGAKTCRGTMLAPKRTPRAAKT